MSGVNCFAKFGSMNRTDQPRNPDQTVRTDPPDPACKQEIASLDELEAAMESAHADLAAALESVDLDKMIPLPRGPKGPFEAPAGILLIQALTHSQHHRGQNASRMRQLGTTPPMTDFIAWYAQGRPDKPAAK